MMLLTDGIPTKQHTRRHKWVGRVVELARTFVLGRMKAIQ